MALRLCILASSSSANAIFVASDSTAILIDAGLSVRQLQERLAPLGVTPAQLAGVCISHEHADHIAGAPALQRRYGTPLYLNAATLEQAQRQWARFQPICRIFQTGQSFAIGDLIIDPFAVPHDAADPVGFVIRNDGVAVGIATDLGIPTTLIRQRLRGCRALVLEANHDEQLLRQSNRPWSLKTRILGRQGHLSNRHAAELVSDVAGPHLESVVLAHVSEECNDPELAVREVRARLIENGWGHVEICTAEQAVGRCWHLAPGSDPKI